MSHHLLVSMQVSLPLLTLDFHLPDSRSQCRVAHQFLLAACRVPSALHREPVITPFFTSFLDSRLAFISFPQAQVFKPYSIAWVLFLHSYSCLKLFSIAFGSRFFVGGCVSPALTSLVCSFIMLSDGQSYHQHYPPGLAWHNAWQVACVDCVRISQGRLYQIQINQEVVNSRRATRW